MADTDQQTTEQTVNRTNNIRASLGELWSIRSAQDWVRENQVIVIGGVYLLFFCFFGGAEQESTLNIDTTVGSGSGYYIHYTNSTNVQAPSHGDDGALCNDDETRNLHSIASVLKVLDLTQKLSSRSIHPQTTALHW